MSVETNTVDRYSELEKESLLIEKVLTHEEYNREDL
jgi:hypothetical protein